MTSVTFAGGPTTIQGEVVDMSGEPLAGAVITAVAQAAGPQPTTTTKKNGTFKLRVPDWNQTYTITAALEGYATAEATFHPDPNDPARVIFTLPTLDESTIAEDPATTAAAVDDAELQANAQRMEAISVFNEGVGALQAENYLIALSMFQEASKLDPDFPEAYRAIAAAAIAQDEYAIAADAAEKLLEFEPDNEEALGTAYYAELMMGNTEGMVKWAQRLADVKPEMVSSELLTHSVALFDHNRYAQSRALLEVILERQPDLAPAKFQLGLTCNKLVDTQCAKEAFSAFLELDPDSPDAPTARSLLEHIE